MANDTKTAFLRLEAGGRTLEAGTGRSDFKIYELSGLSGLEFDFNMASGPQTPNSVIVNQKPLPRKIRLGIRASGDSRELLSSFFNPFVRGRLTVTWGRTTRFIYYYPMPIELTQTTIYREISAEAVLICPEPYWLDTDDYGKNIAGRRELLAFPFVMSRRGVLADYKVLSQEVAILNSGDVPAPATVVFTASGPVKNPALTLNNAEFLRAVADMEKGDTIVFSTDPDDLYVKMNGEDILNKTDPKTTFFQFPTGGSIIEYSADEGTANLNVYIYFRGRFVGL